MRHLLSGKSGRLQGNVHFLPLLSSSKLRVWVHISRLDSCQCQENNWYINNDRYFIIPNIRHQVNTQAQEIVLNTLYVLFN